MHCLTTITRRRLVVALLLLAFCPGGEAAAQLLTRDTRWSGEVELSEDLLIPSGVTLTVAAGTRVRVAPAPSTKTEPAFWNPDTEIAVEGRLVVEGTAEAPVLFVPEPDGRWGGLIGAPGGELELTHVRLEEAREALLLVEARLDAREVAVHDADTGMVVAPGSALALDGVRLTGCKVGWVDLRPGEELPDGVTVEKSEDASFLGTPDTETLLFLGNPGPKVGEADREFVGEYTVEGSERWNGVVVVTGRVTVPPGSLLTLEPGTRVRFRKRDTNGDGLGEGELLVLGSIRSLGRADAPVVFESAEEAPRPGDWDKVSLISSEDPDNRFEHTQFRHGVQALHAHFSSFTARDCRFEENLRAVQFQESERAELFNCTFVGNKQALRFRDSTVRVEGSLFRANLYAVHAFRAELAFADNRVERTLLGGMLAKESWVRMRGNQLRYNRSGLRAKGEGSTLRLEKNTVENSVETAVSLSGVEATFTGNGVDAAGLDLFGLESSTVTMRENTIGRAERHTIHLKDKMKVDARYNRWADEEPSVGIFDSNKMPGLGIVEWKPALHSSSDERNKLLP